MIFDCGTRWKSVHCFPSRDSCPNGMNLRVVADYNAICSKSELMHYILDRKNNAYFSFGYFYV